VCIEPDWNLKRQRELYRCDAYLVLVVDPLTRESDAYGPYDGLTATLRADRFRQELDVADLADVRVTVTRFHQAQRPGLAPAS
jgi:hypothetical protein